MRPIVIIDISTKTKDTTIIAQNAAISNSGIKVSVLTPTNLKSERTSWLVDLHHSLSEAAHGVSYEHVIIVDGADVRKLPQELKDSPDANIVIMKERHGAAIARNFGLHASQGEYITSADDDDLLHPQSLSIRSKLLDSESSYAWVGGLIEDIAANGDHIGLWDCSAKRGHNAPGDILRAWNGHSEVFPIGPTTMLLRRNILQAVGGWGGLPQGEDLTMVMAVTSLFHGYMLDEPVYQYRKHPQQMMQQHGFNILEDSVRRIAFQRAHTLVNLSQ